MQEPAVNGQRPRKPITSRLGNDAARDARARRLERLIPLVHDLLDWELVVRAADGTFVLADDVQRRLQDAVERQSRPAAQVYFGRPCQRCGATGITRLVDSVRLCAPCGRRLLEEKAATAAATDPSAAAAETGAERRNGTDAPVAPDTEGTPRGRREPHIWRLRKVG